MDFAEDRTLPDLLKSPLWLEVRLDDTTWLFELKAGEERAVVVGSHNRADVRITRPGVASMHFHFEREDDAVLLVPGYQAALRLNSVKAPEPCSLEARATVEFSGISLEVVTHRTRPAHLETMRSVDSAADRPSSAEYLKGLPDDTDPTGIAVAAVAGHAPPLSLDTLDVVREAWLTEPTPGGTSEEPLRDALRAGDVSALSQPGTALGPQGTVVIAPVRLRAEDGHSAADAPPSTARLHPPQPRQQWITERIPAARVPEPMNQTQAPPSPDSTPTRLESPAARRSKPPVPLGSHATVMLSPPPPLLDALLGEPRAPAKPAAAITTGEPLSPVQVQPRPLALESQTWQRTADFDVTAMAPFFVTPPSGIAAPSVGVSQTVALANGDVPALPRTSTSSTAPTSRTVLRAPASPEAWLVLLGNAAKRSPLLVGAGALTAAVVLTLALVGASRLLPAATKHRAAASSSPTSAIAPHPAAPSAQPTLAPPSIANSVTVAPLPAIPPSSSAAASNRAPERAGVAADPELAQAVNHLTAGRFAEAESAYLRLSSRDPQNPAYAALSRMLRESAAARCSRKPGASGCPEVRP
ncbi:MAG TPA: hypothetical protein VJN18_01790 [Polyangiaceae bacterium]|nr:hypothetical protein [Polyangiaceae bacterium]